MGLLKKATKVADTIVTRRDVSPPMCNNCIKTVDQCQCIARHVRAQ